MNDETSEIPSTPDARPPSKSRFKRIVALTAIMTIAVIGLAVGYRAFWAPRGEQAASTAIAKEVYYCPMHPQQQSDKPGNCPICSMKLVKMEKPQNGSMAGVPMDKADKPATPSQPATENAIFIAPERQQLIGVKTVPA